MAPDVHSPTPPAETVPWPKMMLPAADVLQWLSKLKPADNVGKKAVFTLRWLAHAEIERCCPEPPPQSITHFTPDEPNSSAAQDLPS
ncbi:hypothetical protein [Hymenobacter terricola]|uniref:hypothetical protein n=1 Tax=Hymenobacter terricola TaxID=2819236 RepID=UPI001B30F656|nr:hypothetical protein [Hymenobacter terricola]